MKPSPSFFTRNGLEYDYNPEAKCPTWLSFLEANWPTDEGGLESQEALQEMFGYLLTGDTSFQKMWAIIGPRNSGKGTINGVLTKLIGEANHVEKSLTDLRAKFGLADVVGKSLMTVSDVRLDKGTPTGRLVEVILNITGEDKVGLEAKFKDSYTEKLNARIVIFGNMELHLPDKAGAIARRLIPIVMTKSWLGREDRDLGDKLARELPGILNWALEGMDRLYDRGHFTMTEAGGKLLHTIMVKASPVMTFMGQCCDEGDADAFVPVDVLHTAFKGWLVERGIKPWHDRERFMDEVATVNRLVEAERREVTEGRRALCFTRLTLKPEYVDRKWETDADEDDL